ncbi:hypothetical protein N7508_004993 [Penicillium antarcticum]|uniref:uncharacterized protein n=1 Tax=Penicillium antarcticum TaxID=416450 RepID=UPI00239DFBEB|nr:uncharacterized protein N7508_004993 [Penicillium antarcticum]KAJ5305978.1 hypothetical protein N7508_004993 [Penicillium antarcticum]
MAYEIGLSTPDVPNRGFPLWICSVVMVITAGLFVLSRLAIRYHHNRLGSDDWMILTSLPAVHHGYGKHAKDLPHYNRVTARKWFFGAQIMYKIVIAVNKLSFLCLYLRIFPQRIFRWSCYIGFGLITGWGLAYLFATIFQCKPIASFWDVTIKNPQCLDKKGLWMSYSLINIGFDLAIIALPIYPLSRLRLQRLKKIGLLVVFGMGAFVCVTTIVRTTTLVQSAENSDSTSGPLPATIWSVIEANTGIICTCLPVFRHPLQYLFPKFFASQSNIDHYNPYGACHTPHLTPSERNLTSAQDDAWRDDHSSKYGLEMLTPDGHRDSHGITKVTDIKVSYDRRSEALSQPARSKEF